MVIYFVPLGMLSSGARTSVAIWSESCHMRNDNRVTIQHGKSAGCCDSPVVNSDGCVVSFHTHSLNEYIPPILELADATTLNAIDISSATSKRALVRGEVEQSTKSARLAIDKVMMALRVMADHPAAHANYSHGPVLCKFPELITAVMS